MLWAKRARMQGSLSVALPASPASTGGCESPVGLPVGARATLWREVSMLRFHASAVIRTQDQACRDLQELLLAGRCSSPCRRSFLRSPMLNLRTESLPGSLLWAAADAPPAIIEKPMPMGICAASSISKEIRDYQLPQVGLLPEVQSMGHHGRSAYLGRGHDGAHYFAKGVGWCLGSGWMPEHGNTGILALWAAKRERDVSLRLAALGLAVTSPVAIFSFEYIRGVNGQLVPAASVPDLDGQPAQPALYVYKSPVRWRLADLPMAPPAVRLQVREHFWKILEILQRSVRLLHAAGGHDYSLSLHNVWADGSRVDFEYVYVPGMPHPVSPLNERVSAWQDKERHALHELAFQLADLVGLDVPAGEMDLRRHLLSGMSADGPGEPT